MKRAISKIERNQKKDLYGSREVMKSTDLNDKKGTRTKSILVNKKEVVNDVTDDIISKDDANNENEDEQKSKKNIDLEEYCSKLSIERINFQFEKYGKYPDDYFQPSVYFYKFLAVKPEYIKNLEYQEKEYLDKIQMKNMKKLKNNHENLLNILSEEEEKELKKKNIPRLKLYIPDTIIMNDPELQYWIYTDEEGYVKKTETFNESDIIEKFKSPTNDESELIGVCKTPIYKGSRLDENQLSLLNIDELERAIFSKQSNIFCIQRFVKCRGPKAFICRTIWRRGKPPYIYILTNKANYNDLSAIQENKFVVKTKAKNSYFTFYATSGKHLDETMVYMNNIVKFIETHSDIVFDELVGDFLKDEAGIWWFINCKAMKVNNVDKFIDAYGNVKYAANLELFISKRREEKASAPKTRKFDYQTKIRCKFCGLEYKASQLKYKLTTKMIKETETMLKHIGHKGDNLSFIDRPDLKHTDCSMVYLPYRVCEDCYLLFETMNDIKTYQIQIANYFRIPVDPLNFSVNYYKKEHNKDSGSDDNGKGNKETNVEDTKQSEYRDEEKPNDHSPKDNRLYRILIMFTDIFLNDAITQMLVDHELFILFNFIGNWYKVKISNFYKELDYININFFKLFYIICNKNDGFLDYIDKNRQMDIKFGYFVKNSYDAKKQIIKNLKKEIIIEDNDICENIQDFVEFASVELSLQDLKYGQNYRNTLNGLLFKTDKPHYVGKLRCIIRINKESKCDNLEGMNCKKHFNFLIPPVNFVTSEELPEYWLELVERLKNRETYLNTIVSVLNKNKITIRRNKDKIFLLLENLVSKNQTSSISIKEND